MRCFVRSSANGRRAAYGLVYRSSIPRVVNTSTPADRECRSISAECGHRRTDVEGTRIPDALFKPLEGCGARLPSPWQSISKVRADHRRRPQVCRYFGDVEQTTGCRIAMYRRGPRIGGGHSHAFATPIELLRGRCQCHEALGGPQPPRSENRLDPPCFAA